MPQPRKRLILRGSCPNSRLCQTSDIHSHSYSNVGFSHPAANLTDIACWDGLHLQYFLCVCLFSDNWPSSQGDAQLSHSLCQVSAVPVTMWCSGLAILCVVMCLIVWRFVLNHAGTTTVHTRLGTSICITSWPAHLVDCLPSVHLGCFWICLLSHCWLHHRVDHCRLL